MKFDIDGNIVDEPEIIRVPQTPRPSRSKKLVPHKHRTPEEREAERLLDIMYPFVNTYAEDLVGVRTC